MTQSSRRWSRLRFKISTWIRGIKFQIHPRIRLKAQLDERLPSLRLLLSLTDTFRLDLIPLLRDVEGSCE